MIWYPLTNVNFTIQCNWTLFKKIFPLIPSSNFIPGFFSSLRSPFSHSTPTSYSLSIPSHLPPSSYCDLPGDSWWIRESGRHRASTPSRPVNMHANVALDISTTAHSGWERGTCGLLCESGGWYGWETGDETERKLIEWETTIGTDSVMPLCVILSLQVETSVAGPLATWELSLRAEPGEWT